MHFRSSAQEFAEVSVGAMLRLFHLTFGKEASECSKQLFAEYIGKRGRTLMKSPAESEVERPIRGEVGGRKRPGDGLWRKRGPCMPPKGSKTLSQVT